MKFNLEVNGSFEDIMNNERHKMGLASTLGVQLAAKQIQKAWRDQVRASGMGTRLSNTIRMRVFPLKGFSYSPAAELYTNADKILDPFNRGVVVLAKSGGWLAIPTPEAGMGPRQRKITPAQWEARTGRKLRLVVNARRRTAFLVADDLEISKYTGLAKAKQGRRRSDGILTGAQTIVIFILIPQATLRKRLDFEGAVTRSAASLPGFIVSNWSD